MSSRDRSMGRNWNKITRRDFQFAGLTLYKRSKMVVDVPQYEGASEIRWEELTSSFMRDASKEASRRSRAITICNLNKQAVNVLSISRVVNWPDLAHNNNSSKNCKARMADANLVENSWRSG